MNKNLTNWIFSCVRTPYMSILNTKDLDINMANYSINKNNIPKSTLDIYIRLETRVLGFLKNLSSDESLQRIEESLKIYLSLLITNNTFLAKEFFTLFEYTRLNTINGELIDLSINQKYLIMGVYLICKILIKEILIDQIFSEGVVRSREVTNNYKICASIIYRSLINYLKENCPIVRQIKQISSFSDENKNARNINKKLYEEYKNPQPPIDKSYSEACEKYNLRHQYDGILNPDEKKSLIKLIKKFPKFDPDRIDSDIESINNLLFKENELTCFYTVASTQNFDLGKIIIEFLDKIINLLENKNG
jgi:hypothetical protein